MDKRLLSSSHRRMASWLVIACLGIGQTPEAWAAAAHGQPQAQAESKADKAKREREEKAAQKDVRSVRENQQALEDIQPELDALGMKLLTARYQDRFLQDYVNALGQSLVPTEAPEGLLFAFRVVDDSTPNAFALPDGRIYINSGLLVFVENEAQLAMVLGHEIGHVIEQHYAEALREAKSPKRLLPGLFAGLGGAAIGAAIGGKDGAAKGAAIGAVAGLTYSFVFHMNSYGRKQEDEADRVGAKLAMDGGYDPRESLAFFQKLTKWFGDQDQFSNLLWGKHSRNVERVESVKALLDTTLATQYNGARTAGRLSAGTGQLQLYASRMFRDTAVNYMDTYDRYDIAKGLLESISDYRARDPKTMWALGRVYTLIGRSEADRAKASDYLQRAAGLDERHLYPYINRDLGLTLAARGGPDMLASAVESLKKYVRGYIDINAAYPPDLSEIYDYLLIFGDARWTAPRVETFLIRRADSDVPAVASADQRPKGGGSDEAVKAPLTKAPATTPAGAPAKKRPPQR